MLNVDCLEIIISYGTKSDILNWRLVNKICKTMADAQLKYKVDWDVVSAKFGLSEDFIRQFQGQVNWLWISLRQKLSESFIREFYQQVFWDEITFTQKLSEPFIRELSKKVYWSVISWSNISQFQELSALFVVDFKDKVDWRCISRCQHFSKSFLDKARPSPPVSNRVRRSKKVK